MLSFMASHAVCVGRPQAFCQRLFPPSTFNNSLGVPGRTKPYRLCTKLPPITDQSCFPGQVVALHDVSSTDAAIIYTMEPVLGAGLAYVVLGERWGSLGWLGAALIIASSLAAQIVGTEEEATPEETKPKQLKARR